MEQTAFKDRPLSILIPVHNEADNIRPFLDELYDKALNHLNDFEVLMLEDGSHDNTPQVLKECESEYKNLVAVTERQRVGYRVTVTKGILRAKKDWILLMDGDGQIEPEDIALLLEQPLSDDIVIAEKFPRCDPPFRIVVSRVFDVLTDMILGISLRDINFGFKLMRTKAAQELAPKCGKLGEIYTAELVIRFVYAGYRLHQLRVRHRKRSRGTSTGIPPSKILSKSWRAFRGICELRKELTS
jgi:glycosyltransferase involved in cell wall biosynthesis